MRTALLTAVVALHGVAALAQPSPESLPAMLQLQPDQHPAWRAYKDALAETRADASHDVAEAARMNAMATPERLDAVRAEMQAETRAFDRQAAATLAFYAALSPEQRQVFDEVTRTPAPPSPMRAQLASPRGEAGPPGTPRLRTPPPGEGLPPPAP